MSARLSFVSIFLNKSRGQKCHCGGKNLTGRICAYFLPSVPILPFPTPHIWGPAASHLPLVLPATRASFLTRGGGLLLHHSHSSQVLTEPLSPPHLFRVSSDGTFSLGPSLNLTDKSWQLPSGGTYSVFLSLFFPSVHVCVLLSWEFLKGKNSPSLSWYRIHAVVEGGRERESE